jgi:hypothetical protein
MARRHRRQNNKQPGPAKGNGRTKTLTTTNAVIEALGGVHALVQVTNDYCDTGVTAQHVCNWRAKGKFPPTYFLVHRHVLHLNHYDAPPELWRVLALPE